MTSVLAKVSCHVNVAKYPFDTQWCEMKLGSWSYASQEINISCPNETGGMDKIAPHGEWDVLEIPCTINRVKYACCDAMFTDISYTVVVRRKPMFYIYNILFAK